VSAAEAPRHGLPPGGRAPDRVWWLETADAVRLRAALWRAERPVGHAILLSGRTEFIEKTSLTAAGLVARRLSAVSVDWRGQGLSDRLVEPPAKGHVGDFAEFQVDLDALLADPETVDLPGPRVMVAHSMGALVGVAALARPEAAAGVRAAILSAPLFGLNLPWWLRILFRAAILTARLLRQGERWPPFGRVATTYALTEPGKNVLTTDPGTWAWLRENARANPQLTIATPTLAWFDAMERETARVRRLPPPPCRCLCLLGGDERVVQPRAIRDWCAAAGARLAEVPGARHEPFAEAPPLRAMAWAAVDEFLAETAALDASAD